MDKIVIEGIRCQGRIGITPEERAAAQELRVDLCLEVDLEAAANTDDLSLTVDYVALVEKVRHVVSTSQACLLERLSRDICRKILEEGRIRSVRATVRKFPLELREKAEWVAVEMTRSTTP